MTREEKEKYRLLSRQDKQRYKTELKSEALQNSYANALNLAEIK
jgi:hypothetical protein